MRTVVADYINTFNNTLNFKGLSWWLIDIKNTPEVFHCNENMCEAFNLNKNITDHLIASTCPIAGDYNNLETSTDTNNQLILSEYNQLLSQEITEYNNTFPYFDAESGNTHHFSSRAQAIEINDNGDVTLLFGIIEDVTTKVNQSTAFKNLSEHDELTKLYNRRKFYSLFEHESRRALRSQTNVAIIMIDVDYFKEYNDINGHIEGDICLFNVANILNKTLKRDVDVIARYGGEEFIVLLTDITFTALTMLAKSLVINIENAKITHGGSVINEHLTISLGAAIGKLKTLDNSLISAADEMLYQVKTESRNNFAITSITE